MIKIAICDDLESDRINLCKILLNLCSKLNFAYELKEFSSGEELLKVSDDMDIIFLDVVMDKLDGIETFKKITNENAIIAFMSTTSDRLREMFDFNVVAFLDKPLDESKVESVLLKAQNSITKDNEDALIFIKNGKRNFINYNDIIYIEVVGHYIKIFTKDEVITYKNKIKDVWDTLSQNDAFAMPNRSFIVNMKYVSISSKTEFKIKSLSYDIPISRTNKDDTIKRFMAYISNKGSKEI